MAPKKTAGRVKLPKPTPQRTVGRKRKGQGSSTPGTHQPHWTADYTADEWEFMLAVEEWKRRTGCAFPSWRDVLGIVVGLGYRKTASHRPGGNP